MNAKVISETVVLMGSKIYAPDCQTVADLCASPLAHRPATADDDKLPRTRSPLVAARLLGFAPSRTRRRRYGWAT